MCCKKQVNCSNILARLIWGTYGGGIIVEMFGYLVW